MYYEAYHNILYIVCNPFSIPDPVKLIGEGEYNLNAVKEIKVTESSLGLGEAVLECQDTEDVHDCTTRHYIDAFMASCGCLPFNIWTSKNVLFNL